MSIRSATLGIAATVLVLAGSMSAAQAFTASNPVGSGPVGDGSGSVSGYAVSGIHYESGSNPQMIDTVRFTLDTAPVAGSTIKVRLQSGGSWYTCANASASISCSTASPQITIGAIDRLTVVVTQ